MIQNLEFWQSRRLKFEETTAPVVLEIMSEWILKRVSGEKRDPIMSNEGLAK